MLRASYPGTQRTDTGNSLLALQFLEVLLLVWIFSGVMGRMIPVFFMPGIKSLRPHYFVASAMAGLILVNLVASKYTFGRAYSFCFLSLTAWVAFIGIALVSFFNLSLMQVFFYPRELGTDCLIIKWALMSVLMSIFIHFHYVSREREDLIRKIVRVLDWSFIAYFLIGCPLYVAMMTHKISVETYTLFVVPSQDLGNTFMRFGPGDYPNGAGEMLAFYVIFLLFMRRHLKYVPLKFIVAIPTLIFTMTRSCIIPALGIVVLFMIYIFFRKFFSKDIYKLSRYAILTMMFVVTVLLFMVAVFKDLQVIGDRVQLLYYAIVNITESATVLKRIELWQEALEVFYQTTYMGNGFARYLETHNLLLELLAEIGVAGTVFYVLFTLFRIFAIVAAYLRASYGKRGMYPDFIRMLLVAVPVNTLFALTNHNLFHFVFWFLVVASFIVEGRYAGLSSRG
jgi:hypothetical protein